MAPITFAHRGARAELPENTLAAFGRALDAGARGLESDARLSGDGEVVLAHDGALWRGLRRLRVDRTPASALVAIDVPRLADLYATYGHDYELSIDLKAPGVTQPLLEIAVAADAVDRLWLCSGNVSALRRIRLRASDVRLVHSTRRRALSEPLERYASDLAEAAIDAVNLHHTDWTAGLVGLFHRFGLRAFAWDVQEARHLRAVLAMQVDGVYSDHVDRMVATVAEWADG